MRVPASTFPLGGVHWTLEETCVWVDLVSPSSLFQGSVDCADFSSRQSDPDASCDRHSVAVALSPSLMVAMTAIAVRLVVFASWLAPYFSLTGTYIWPFLRWMLAVPSDWVDLPSPSSYFQDSVSCLTCSHDSQLLRHPAIDIVWRWPCLPRFRLLQTPCYCGVLGGLKVLVGFLTYPSNG